MTGGQHPSCPASSGTSTGAVNSSHGHFSSPGHGEARCLWVSLYKKMPPRTKRLGPCQLCSIQVPRHQTSSLSIPVVNLPPTSFANYWDVHQLYNILCYSPPSTPINVDSTWSQHCTPTLTLTLTAILPCTFNLSFSTTFSHPINKLISLQCLLELSLSSLCPLRDSSSLSATSPYKFLKACSPFLACWSPLCYLTSLLFLK